MKIKWNWGTKLFIFTTMFMIFILVFVYLTTLQDRTLVEDEYYQHSLVFQEKINKINNSNALQEKVEIIEGPQHISITFQTFFNPAEISGTIHFYRPSNIKGDVIIPIELDSTRQIVYPVKKLMRGRYIVKIDYKYKDKEFYQEKSIFIE
ncbi:MAG: hypothetical protein B6D61_09415 [Bacteroidetes bacterium 4484_249]|nr:MAG: hypothetical protein B6D61_09415 [Bacteroidetes bacterium 4484_249]